MCPYCIIYVSTSTHPPPPPSSPPSPLGLRICPHPLLMFPYSTGKCPHKLMHVSLLYYVCGCPPPYHHHRHPHHQPSPERTYHHHRHPHHQPPPSPERVIEKDGRSKRQVVREDWQRIRAHIPDVMETCGLEMRLYDVIQDVAKLYNASMNREDQLHLQRKKTLAGHMHACVLIYVL